MVIKIREVTCFLVATEPKLKPLSEKLGFYKAIYLYAIYLKLYSLDFV